MDDLAAAVSDALNEPVELTEEMVGFVEDLPADLLEGLEARAWLDSQLGVQLTGTIVTVAVGPVSEK